MEIVFKRSCNFNGERYEVGDRLTDYKDVSGIIRLNEKGFIKPLTNKELKAIANGSFLVSEKKKYEIKEED